MQPKLKGWKEGVIMKDLKSMGGSIHRKGDRVRYRAYKVYPDKDGYRHSFKQWYVVDLDNKNLVRTCKLEIENESLTDFYEEYNAFRNKIWDVPKK